MGTHNKCLYKEVDKKYIGCNVKTTEWLDCILIGICVVIRLNMVYCGDLSEVPHGCASDESLQYMFS